MAERRIFTDYEKKTLYAKYDGRCAICGKPVKFKEMTVDHKTPLSRGGTNDMSNLQVACNTCNRLKNALDMAELLDKIRQILRHNRRWRKEMFG